MENAKRNCRTLELIDSRIVDDIYFNHGEKDPPAVCPAIGGFPCFLYSSKCERGPCGHQSKVMLHGEAFPRWFQVIVRWTWPPVDLSTRWPQEPEWTLVFSVICCEITVHCFHPEMIWLCPVLVSNSTWNKSFYSGRRVFSSSLVLERLFESPARRAGINNRSVAGTRVERASK